MAVSEDSSALPTILGVSAPPGSRRLRGSWDGSSEDVQKCCRARPAVLSSRTPIPSDSQYRDYLASCSFFVAYPVTVETGYLAVRIHPIFRHWQRCV